MVDNLISKSPALRKLIKVRSKLETLVNDRKEKLFAYKNSSPGYKRSHPNPFTRDENDKFMEELEKLVKQL